ncbi:DUF1217 domain-containing protein [Yoonia sp.]|uniref:DUF1217 domain-containing protein n=1 Tax=Yoonia sp. TaxID=2212373 RepID=UPI0025D9A55D|nr:DUF1217 domain-containing protein [Yoonia sp.]
MAFQPVLPVTGYVGWRFLERTLEKQQTAFAESQPIARATDYFREKIGNVRTVDDLVNDRHLLSVALGAFGLDDDINSQFFIRKILADGTTADDALANRLADKRYLDFSRTFGFGGDGAPRTGLVAFPDEIVSRFEARQFERAVGEQNNDLRLALNVASGVSDIVESTSSQNAQWFSMMGNAPLRNVFQTALGLPSGLASIDLDQQLGIFKERSKSIFGTESVGDFTDPDQQEKLVRLFLIRSEAAAISVSSGASTALTLLQSASSRFAR